MLSRLYLSWRKRFFRSSLSGRCRPIRSRLPRTLEPLVELLEDRFLPSVSLNIMEFHDPSRIPTGVKPSAFGILPKNNGSSIPTGLLPSDLQTGYGFNRVMFGSIVG